MEKSQTGEAVPLRIKLQEVKVSLQLKLEGFYIYFFFPSRIVYFYRKIRNKELHKAKYNEFNFQPLKGEKMNEIYEKSRCVLDSAQDGQIGLTIRVIEALGAKKRTIAFQFFVETLIIGQLGGLVGILLGILTGYLIAIAIDFSFVIPWLAIMAAVITTFIVAVVSGSYPAIKASKLDPIEALRYE